MKNFLTPKNPKIWDPILVTLLKMRHHYSQSSRENATLSSGTSPLVSYKEVPPPPGGILICSNKRCFDPLNTDTPLIWTLSMSPQCPLYEVWLYFKSYYFSWSSRDSVAPKESLILDSITVNCQMGKKLTVNRQSYHPIEGRSRTYLKDCFWLAGKTIGIVT